MEVILHSTDKIVTLFPNDDREESGIPARLWEGVTSSGITVHAYITWIAVPEGLPDGYYATFEKELRECAKPSAPVAAIPLRLIL